MFLIKILKDFFFTYPTPINLSFMWNFGVLSFIYLIIQIVTGIFISMHFIGDGVSSFFSIEDFVRNISFGWFLRYLHANGASFFFACVFVHIIRNLYFRSYKKPRELIWNTGIIIFIIMVFTAFTGYVLPWGQMSFWAATVITNLFTAIPFVGFYITIWLWGNFSVGNVLVTRFLTFHFLLPFIILLMVIVHFIFLHLVGSSNKLNILIKFDKIQFNPYYTIKDLFAILIFFFLYTLFFGFNPNYLGHPDNYIMADPLVTPSHIVPEWYFLLFYAMLRSIPSKIGGILVLLSSLIILLVFHFLLNIILFNIIWNFDKFNYLESNNMSLFLCFYLLNIFIFNELNIYQFWLFLISSIFLSIIGSKSIEYPYLILGRIFTFFYFIYFIYLIFENYFYNYFKVWFNYVLFTEEFLIIQNINYYLEKYFYLYIFQSPKINKDNLYDN